MSHTAGSNAASSFGLGLTEATPLPEVLGFDLQEEHLERARAFAAQQGLTNVRFEVGNIYKPPAAPESFDVAYTNAVLPTSLTRPARCRLRKAYSRRAD